MSSESRLPIERLRRLADVLDNWLVIPGTRWRIGLDGIIGLIPGYGDAVGLVLSAYVIFEAARCGVPPRLLMRMAGNVLVEIVIGVIPTVGDVFDFIWKANERNVQLLRVYLGHIPPPPPVNRIWRLLFAALLVAVMLFIALVVFWLAWVGYNRMFRDPQT